VTRPLGIFYFTHQHLHPRHRARTSQLRDAIGRSVEGMTGGVFSPGQNLARHSQEEIISLSPRQRLALLCMGGHGVLYFSTIVETHKEPWQRNARSK
jgi:hypothetical protein